MFELLGEHHLPATGAPRGNLLENEPRIVGQSGVKDDKRSIFGCKSGKTKAEKQNAYK